jgi:hypothetical protein
MRYQEILEACWKGYQQQGMKNKSGRQVPNCVPVSEQELEEDLKKWFKEKWVRFGPDGKIRGDCARGSSKEGKPKCLPQAKAQALGKKGRASSAAKKRREDPNPERRGAAKNVATRVKEQGVEEAISKKDLFAKLEKDLTKITDPKNKDAKPVKWTGPGKDDYGYTGYQGHGMPTDKQERELNRKKKGVAEADLDEACWKGYHKEGMKTMFGKRYPNCVKNKNESLEVYINRGECPGCGGRMVAEEQIAEKQDACYHKVKSRYKVWPSAYASGALVQCRKKGAANWGNKGKK